MKPIKIVVLIALMFNFSCASNQAFLSKNALNELPNHHRLAVIPFQVTFSNEYRQISRLGRNADWHEEERVAGIDLQKQTFIYLSKRALKKNWPLTVQDFLTTNKILEKNKIGFSELQQADKSAIARILEVDAVVWGTSTTEYSMRNYGRNGINSQMMLFDANTNELVWQNNTTQYLTTRMDSPQSLANSCVSSLINTMPYMSAKK